MKNKGQKKTIFCKLLLLSAACWLLISFFSATYGVASEISAVNVKLVNNELLITTSVSPDQKFIDSMNEGMSKEFVFYIDLFRVWKVWPDEFVIGKKIVMILKSDPIKREYVATSLEGNTYLEKRFKNVEAMLGWAMNISDTKLTNVRELEAGTYFVKVTVESTIRKLPPVIGYLFFFVPEKEFSLSKNSPPLQINTK